MFLSGTLLNVAAVLAGTTIGLLAARRLSSRVQESLTTGLGLFVLAISVAMAVSIFDDPVAKTGDSLVVLAGLLIGVVVGEALRLHDRLEGLGGWLQARLARGERPSRIAEAFVTASLVFCVGPLTVLGSLDNGLRNDITLLATKSLLDGVASVAFAAVLGAGVYLAAVTVLVVQGAIAAGAFLLQGLLEPRVVLVVTATGGLILVGTGLRLLDLKAVRVASFLPSLVVAPALIPVADAIRGALG